MNLLVVSARPPWPPVMADAMTVDQLVRFLTARGHAVDLLCFTEGDEADQALREGLAGVCREITTVTLPRWRSCKYRADVAVRTPDAGAVLPLAGDAPRN
jgi:hypothetical protein